MLDIFSVNILEMQRVLSSYAYFYLNQVFSIPERTELYLDFERVFDKGRPMNECKYIKFNAFFINQEKLNRFKDFFIEAKTNLEEFKVNLLAGVSHRPQEPLKKAPKSYPPLFSEGIEIYKRKGNSIHDMGINYSDPELMAIATDKGSKEISILDSLRSKNRTVDGLRLQDEDIDDQHKGNKAEYSLNDYNNTLNSSFIVACLSKLNTSTVKKFECQEAIQYSQWLQPESILFCKVHIHST